MGICRLCEKDKKLVQSHIIAKCLLGPLLSQEGPPIAIARKRNTFPKRLPKGEYDNDILCGECDAYFSAWEEYTADIWFRKNELYKATETAWKQGKGLLLIHSYDYAKVKLCLLSILWRMSISKREMFDAVQLGRYESRIRNMLLAADPGPWNKLPIVVFRQLDKNISDTIGPMRSKVSGVNTYRLGLPGYLVVIGVDNRPMKDLVPGAALTPRMPLCVGLRETDMHKLAHEMATLHVKQKLYSRKPAG